MYSGKSKEELEKTLASLKDELEEVQEERQFVLGQTGLHVSGGTVKKFDAEVSALNEKIQACEKALANS